jgi:hypothetical protein
MAESPTMEVRARLTAETAQFTKGMQQASASVDQFTQKSDSLRGAMVGIGVASAALTTALIAMGTKSFLAAARIEELDYAMDAIGKSTGLGYQAIKDTALAIKAEGIEMEIASKTAIKFAQNHLDMSKAALLAKAAQDFAIVGAKNSSETYDMLTHAVITGRSEVLKSVGIQKSAGQMYEAYAKTLGKSAAALTYQEKQQAVLTGALEEAKNVAGAYEAAMQSPGKVLRSFARMSNEIQVSMGNMLLKGIGPVIFHLYELTKQFAKALENSVAFRIAIEAVKQVVIKFTAPIVAFLKYMKTMLEGMTKVTDAAGELKSNFDPVGDAVKNLATKIEFVLPPLAALLAMFATFAGARVFASIPVLGSVLGMLAGPIGIVVIGLTTLYLTSNQVKDAVNRLFVALSPLVGIVVSVGKALATAAGYGVAILAKAIGGLATIIQGANNFLSSHRGILNGIKYVIGVLVASYIGYKAVMLAQLAVTKVSAIMTAIHAKMTNAQTIANLTAIAATAKLNYAEAANTVITIKNTIAQLQNNIANGAGVAATAALAVANAQLTIAESAAAAAKTASASAQAALTSATVPYAAIVFGVVAAIAALTIAFVIAWKNSETFREVVTAVINFVAKVIGKAVAFIIRALGYFVKGIAYVMDTNNALGKMIATVYEFILDTIIFAVISYIKFYKYWLDAFSSVVKEHAGGAKLVGQIFEFIARYIGAAITYVLLQYAVLIKGLATLIYYFGVLKDWIGEKWKQIVEAIGRATQGISKIFGVIGDLVGGITDFMKEKFAGFVDFLVEGLEKVPYLFRGITGNLVLSQLKKLQGSLRDTTDEVAKFDDSKGADSLATKITGAVESINSGITSVSKVLIQNVKEFGNYEGGIAGTLSNVANKIVNVAEKVTNFAGNVDGDKILGGMVKGAEKASEVLGKTIDLLQGIKDKDIFKTVMKVVSDGANTASEWLLATATVVESFTNSDFAGKMGDVIGGMVDGLKKGLGFGDILGDLQKEFSLPSDLGKDENAEAIEAQKKRADAIKEAMQSAIDSIKGVLDDLKNAARDFADSLKDTIVGFAGLRSIELPDGFIPKAKSLIDNMNQRLNKSLQFANQIAQLQSLELDAGALKDIIEAGPIKGAQLASSILTGDAKSNIAQINALQKAITYSGAAIGQMGAQAAYGGLIANAEAKYASLQGDLKTGGSGTNQYIQQGAFQINISTAGAKDTDEQIKMITDKIQETFAILAKELAAK